MNPIDKLLNSITMYRVVLYSLVILSVSGIIFGFLGMLPYSGVSLILSLGVILTVAYIIKMLFVILLKAKTNFESSLITAFILFLILAPIVTLEDAYITAGITAIAIASKFILVYGKKHIFNPAAIGIVLAGLFGFGNGIWWIGSLVMLPLVLILGLLIVRKVRRFEMFGIFVLVSLITITMFNLRNGLTVFDSLTQVFTSWPLLFFGTVMLTEPLTSPHRKKQSLIYSGIVGILFGSQFSLGPLHASPEFALIVGNIYAFIVSPKYALSPKLQKIITLSPGMYEFIFTKERGFTFIPGQYSEWTLPEKVADSRGNRRYFTLASSPTEDVIKLGVKIDANASSKFKKTLLAMKKDDTIGLGSLAGDFTLPEDKTLPLTFIAGGIGITPFRSMLKHLMDTNEKRVITLFYSASDPKEFVYTDQFQVAVKQLGIQVIYIITREENKPNNWKGEVGRLTPEMIMKYTNDVARTNFYLSGPNAMVDSYKRLLKAMGVTAKNITTDYFSGY